MVVSGNSSQVLQIDAVSSRSNGENAGTGSPWGAVHYGEWQRGMRDQVEGLCAPSPRPPLRGYSPVKDVTTFVPMWNGV